jgi:hypothetical protein
MDLNYLFYRQQVEQIMAEAASSEAVRKIHAALASHYEERISEATAAGRLDEKARPLFRWPVSKTDFVEAPKENPIMAVAMTAREVETGQR